MKREVENNKTVRECNKLDKKFDRMQEDLKGLNEIMKG